jgi:selenocysteine lyase/cysteine desulfurase
LSSAKVQVHDGRFRAPHVLSLGFPDGLPPDLIPALAGQQIYVAARLGRMRVSPHVYNDEADVDRFIAAMTRGTG